MAAAPSALLLSPAGQAQEAAHAVGAHRIATRRFAGHVRVERDGRVIAASNRAVALEETGLPTRFYLRREPPSPPANRASSRIGEGLNPLTIR